MNKFPIKFNFEEIIFDINIKTTKCKQTFIDNDYVGWFYNLPTTDDKAIIIYLDEKINQTKSYQSTIM